LRSVAANLPHRKVWIFGHCPSWVAGVGAVELDPLTDKFANQKQSIKAAVSHPGVSDQFVLMNDDMYVMREIGDELPCWHLGSTEGYIASIPIAAKQKNDWIEAVLATARWVGGGPDCYEAHIPLLFDKGELARVLNRYPSDRPFAVGEVYGIAGVNPGHLGIDAKIGSGPLEPKLGLPFLSTVDHLFGVHEVGFHIRRLFPEKGIYEC
jgi:hypothetical protein